MKIRSVLTAAFVSALMLGLLAPGAATAKKAAGPIVVGTDDAADWGVNADPTITPLGAPLGQELVEASIGMADPKTINFIIKVAGLPPSGGLPEFSRYNWDFTVNGTPYQLTGAFTDYLRGVCNPLHTNACPPPQDPGQQPFFLRSGPCTVTAECNLLATFQATFDAAESTITIS